MAATIATLIQRIEERIAISAGLDVQIHAEARLLEMLRHAYNTFFDAHWWNDFMVSEEFTVSAESGTVNDNLENKVRRFVDIHSVYLNDELKPLPVVSLGINPRSIRRPALVPITDVSKVFKITPLSADATINMWYRTRLSDTEWESEDNDTVEVNVDDELLICAVTYDFLVDDGTNDEAAKKYQQKTVERLQRLKELQHQHPIPKSGQEMSVPATWREDSPW